MHSSFSPLQKPRQNLQNHCQISCVNRNPTPYGLRAGLRAIWFGVETGADTGFFFSRGCTRLLLYFNTIKPHIFFLQNTNCIRKPQVISGRGGGGGGRGGAHPLHLDPLLRNITRRKNGFAQIALGKSVAKLKKSRSESRAKMVDDTFASLFTTP